MAGSRGYAGVELFTNEAQLGLEQAVAEVFVSAAWQRYREHFLRNSGAQVPESAQRWPPQQDGRSSIKRIASLWGAVVIPAPRPMSTPPLSGRTLAAGR